MASSRREFIGSMFALSMAGGCALQKADDSAGPVNNAYSLVTVTPDGTVTVAGQRKEASRRLGIPT